MLFVLILSLSIWDVVLTNKLGMPPRNVFVEMILARSLILTMAAMKGFFSCVCSYVAYEIYVLAKNSTTIRTGFFW